MKNILEPKTISEMKTMNKNQRHIIESKEAVIKALKEELSQSNIEIEKLEERIRMGSKSNDRLKEQLENSVSKSFCLDIIRAARLELKTN